MTYAPPHTHTNIHGAEVNVTGTTKDVTELRHADWAATPNHPIRGSARQTYAHWLVTCNGSKGFCNGINDRGVLLHGSDYT